MVNHHFVDNNIGNPASVSPVSPDFNIVTLHLSTSLQRNTIYHITVNLIKDCLGNTIAAHDVLRFAIPEFPLANDIIINEVMYDPQGSGVDFVEVYNRSQKVVDLKYMRISSFDTINNILTHVNVITTNGYLMFPGDYVVISTDPAIVKQQYYTPNPNGFVQIASMPPLDNGGGTSVLSDTLQNVIDKFTYSPNMQFALLTSTKGVSLERLDPERATSDPGNWHSASQDVGFATPAYKNSEYSTGKPEDNTISLNPEIFSPDDDGYNDVLNINYKFDQPGYVGNVTIYDAKGRLIRLLVKSNLLATEGIFTWDGLNDNHEKARIGVYIVYFETFNLQGDVKK